MAESPDLAGAADAAGYRFGLFEIDRRTGELRKQGTRLRLRGRPIDILLILMASPGQVVSREELRTKLWPADTFVDFDHGLHSAVNRLREAVNDSADNPRFIETLPRKGYRFIAPVTRIAAAPIAHVVGPPPADIEIHGGQPPTGSAAPTPLAVPAAVVEPRDVSPTPEALDIRDPRPGRLRSWAVAAALALVTAIAVAGLGI